MKCLLCDAITPFQIFVIMIYVSWDLRVPRRKYNAVLGELLSKFTRSEKPHGADANVKIYYGQKCLEVIT